MRYRSKWVFAVLFLSYAVAGAAFAQSPLKVDEPAIRVQLAGEGVRVALPVENILREGLSANVLLELVSPQGSVQSHATQSATFPPGRTQLNIVLPPLAQDGVADPGILSWFRLRYSIAIISPQDAAGKAVVGIISVSEAAPRLFELHVAGPPFVKPGSSGTLLVRAVHPVTLRPIDGVTVQASLDVDSDAGKPLLTNEATTDKRGFATLRFSLPREIDTEDIEVKVTGKQGNLTAEAEKELHLDRFATIRISTDKSLYQPGQTVHVRLIAIDPNNKAIAKQAITLRILDEENTLVFLTNRETSRFGVASADWQVPDNLRLGIYTIRVNRGGSDEEDRTFIANVKISRYDLPSFSVRVKPDRAYYLPGQDASVEVAADYLFGEPVGHGHVRVVRETERKWNFREQKWDTKEEKSYEGDTDGQGHYVAHLDLAGEQDQLTGEDYNRFRDISFAAYFTDFSTGKTEQRRFNIRITKEPIHVYTLGLNGFYSKWTPLEFYLSVDYADGTPAECDVDINWSATQSSRLSGSVTLPDSRFLRRVRTNRYGIAKVTRLNLPGGAEIEDFELSFQARDRKGLVGHHTESASSPDRPGILVKTDKTLYSSEDPIAVELTSTEPDATLTVEATHGFEVVARQLVRVRHGHASLLIPPSEKFQNEVSVVAFLLGGRDNGPYSALMGYHTVYFPKKHGLNIDVHVSKATFKPGEEAAAVLRVSGPEGLQKESALGLVVVDKAVEERAESDSDFHGESGFYGFRKDLDQGTALQGIQLSDLDKLDLTKPLPDGLELVAEAMLQNDFYLPEVFSSNDNAENLSKIFASEINPVLDPIRSIFENRYKLYGQYSNNEAALRNELAAAGIRLEDLRDPWGTPYRPSFSVQNEMDVFTLTSAGPDKTFGTDDDFSAAEMSWRYFKTTAEAIQRAVNDFHARTGNYIRDEKSLQSELAEQGIDFTSLRDPWGHPYRLEFGVNHALFTITVSSAGPDGRFDTERTPSGDDFSVAAARIDYFEETATRMDAALSTAYNRDHVFPESPEQFEQILQNSGIRWEELRDPWGHPYYVTFRQEAMYADDVVVQTYQTYLGKREQHTTITPVTRQMNFLYLRSAGEDGVEGTSDDFPMAAFSRFSFQESAIVPFAGGGASPAIQYGSSGAISGIVTDQSGGAIVGASVMAKDYDSGVFVTVMTDDSGKYVLRNLPAGMYAVEFWSRGFRSTRITQVPVRSSSVTKLDATLEVGSTDQTITVTESVPLVETTNATLSGRVTGTKITSPPQLSSTPRLREFFPETLFWQPELVTDKAGPAQIRVPLADNITTWKLSVIASTEDGEIGMADKEIRAFQPFFAEHDPPRFLTAGDEIDLPVVLRNYLDRSLQISTVLKPEAWFSALGPTTVKTEVPRHDSARAVFKFRAVEPVKDGKQRITATAAETGDAIERKVTVRPNGEDRSVTTSQVFGDTSRLDFQIPDGAIPGSIEGTLKIYPNLQAHLLESIEGIMEWPYGCAEQVISSSYPSLLFLRYTKESGIASATASARAKRNVELAYQKLLSYVTPDGAVTYWGRGDADPALTAYTLRFLNDASEFIAVDDSAAENPLMWLLHSAPQENGRWIARDWQGKEDLRRSAMLTAYITRVIATTKISTQDAKEKARLTEETAAAVKKAFAYLEPEIQRYDEPYLLASYGLASLAVGEKARVTESVKRLLSLEHREGDFSYWSLETNTPFYGWGLTGRIETTALVLQLLAKAGETGADPEQLRSRGLLFLLRNQDRFGVWYSTQATVNVLDTIGSLTSSRGPAVSGNYPPGNAKASILLDGRQVLSVDLPAPNELTAPVVVDMTKFMSAGIHSVQMDRQAGASQASAQLVAAYYMPWPQSTAVEEVHREEKSSEALRLHVRFSKSSANVGDAIQCHVDAERIGFRGYGMMLAEIGLPPGADVDRSSLDKAMKESGWDISQYDVLPDRLVVYLWPHAGGTKFFFTFKPRFGLKAQTAPSVLYDYYNPEARAVVPPLEFTVR